MQVPFYPANILLPKCDYEKWSVIACDQYTSDAEYWRDVERIVGEAPSTLKITLPEIYLEENNVDCRVKKINDTMNEYLNSGLFEEYNNTFIYVERTLRSDVVRKGIVGVVDLEEYDYSPNSISLIRATEKTVVERIPPRVRIRKNAPLEIPHIMLLFDDPGDSIFASIEKFKPSMKKLYDFPLMKNSGYVAGWEADDAAAEVIISGFNNLFKRRMEREDGNLQFMFAVGDGNHSLATAKTCWENIKPTLSSDEQTNHPARYALVEAVNIHDISLSFEPVHRVLFNTDEELFRFELKNYFKDNIKEDCFEIDDYNDFVTVSSNQEHVYQIINKESKITLGHVQEFIDYYMSNIDIESRIDYIHGDGVAIELGKQAGNVALLMPSISKNDLFDMVTLSGVLPRKTFSMGDADDKRFYIEAKIIK